MAGIFTALRAISAGVNGVKLASSLFKRGDGKKRSLFGSILAKLFGIGAKKASGVYLHSLTNEFEGPIPGTVETHEPSNAALKIWKALQGIGINVGKIPSGQQMKTAVLGFVQDGVQKFKDPGFRSHVANTLNDYLQKSSLSDTPHGRFLLRVIADQAGVAVGHQEIIKKRGERITDMEALLQVVIAGELVISDLESNMVKDFPLKWTNSFVTGLSSELSSTQLVIPSEVEPDLPEPGTYMSTARFAASGGRPAPADYAALAPVGGVMLLKLQNSTGVSGPQLNTLKGFAGPPENQDGAFPFLFNVADYMVSDDHMAGEIDLEVEYTIDLSPSINISMETDIYCDTNLYEAAAEISTVSNRQLMIVWGYCQAKVKTIDLSGMTVMGRKFVLTDIDADRSKGMSFSSDPNDPLVIQPAGVGDIAQYCIGDVAGHRESVTYHVPHGSTPCYAVFHVYSANEELTLEFFTKPPPSSKLYDDRGRVRPEAMGIQLTDSTKLLTNTTSRGASGEQAFIPSAYQFSENPVGSVQSAEQFMVAGTYRQGGQRKYVRTCSAKARVQNNLAYDERFGDFYFDGKRSQDAYYGGEKVVAVVENLSDTVWEGDNSFTDSSAGAAWIGGAKGGKLISGSTGGASIGIPDPTPLMGRQTSSVGKVMYSITPWISSFGKLFMENLSGANIDPTNVAVREDVNAAPVYPVAILSLTPTFQVVGNSKGPSRGRVNILQSAFDTTGNMGEGITTLWAHQQSIGGVFETGGRAMVRPNTASREPLQWAVADKDSENTALAKWVPVDVSQIDEEKIWMTTTALDRMGSPQVKAFSFADVFWKLKKPNDYEWSHIVLSSEKGGTLPNHFKQIFEGKTARNDVTDSTSTRTSRRDMLHEALDALTLADKVALEA